MSNRKKNIILLCSLLIVLFVLVILFCFYFCKDNSIDILFSNDTSTNNDIIEGQDSNEFNSYVEDKVDTDIDNIYNEMDDTVDDIEDNKINVDTMDSYNEDDVVSYFQNMYDDIEQSGSFKDKFKNYFIIIVDFIFYNGEIKGYTFSELSDITKVQIVGLALKIDSKIEEYIPNYKESISNSTGRVYTDIKEKLVTSYMDISSTICNNNENECDKVKEIFGEIKNVCKIGWEFIKNLVKDGFSRLKEWYEIYSGK